MDDKRLFSILAVAVLCPVAVCNGLTPCQVCVGDSGICVRPFQNGTFSQCQCPAFNCSSSIGNGCDVYTGCSPVDSTCDLDESVPCWDVNAECVIHGLSSYRVCTCSFGYVAVYTDDQPTRCHKRLSSVQDDECTECIENGGLCFDNADNEDSYQDGCVCPPTRVTNFTLCDTHLFDVSCTQENMTVCYDPPSHISGYENIAAKLDAEEYLLFATGHVNDRACHFTPAADVYCLTLGFDENKCGLLTADTTSAISYSADFRLQKEAALQTSEEVNLYAYCSFNILKGVASGALDVLDTQRIGMEGQVHQAMLDIVVLNLNDKDMKDTGLTTGDDIKIRLWISDDADGLYTSLEAEVCVISDQLSLNHPVVHTVPIIVHGCPVEPLLHPEDQFRTVESNLSVIETGMFQTPKFPATNYIFVHCAVRACFKDEECSLNACGPVRRRRRSLADPGRYMNILLDDPSIQHQYIALKYWQPDVSAIGAGAGEDMESNLLTWTWITIGATLLLLLFVGLTALVMRISLSSRHRSPDVVSSL